MDWPSSETKLIENFGSNKNGMPLLGDVFNSTGPVFSADSGELIFSRNTEDERSRIPSTFGTWLAIDHDDGIISMYSRVQEASRDLPAKIEKNEVIAFSGKSGWSNTDGFTFTIYDRKERRWVNPSAVIAPEPDTVAPVLQYVRLRSEDGSIKDLRQDKTIRQGRWAVIVNPQDAKTASNDSLMPFKIEISVNGIESGFLSFETFFARDGMLMMYRNGLVPVSKIYSPYPALDMGDVWFNRGQATLEIIVEDVAKNSRRYVYKILVE
jgi:murein DD-endopeptidase MepM/ murein hydrolase activator NlpD